MTGEITLSGLVFPVGGIKEKVLAAHRAGIRRIILPERNEADIEDIPEDVRNELEIIPAKYISDVLSAALESEVTEPMPKNYTLPNVERAADGANAEPLIAKEKS
jgi:ATP-dependent Lon protease